MNEYDKRAQFYTLIPIEYKIRQYSKRLFNGYFVAFFACCRELFKLSIHCGCVGAMSNQEAWIEFEKREEHGQIKQA